MNDENLLRELQKIKQAIDLATTYHVKDNEKNAALHGTTDVLYSPLTSRLLTSQKSLERIMRELEDEENGSAP